MTKTEIEETLALQWAGLPDIPEEVNEKTPVWIYALARVLLHSMRESWVVVRMNYGREPVIIKSFCDSGVAKILSLHPFKFLDRAYLPAVKSIDETRRFISGVYGVSGEDVAKLKKPELLRLLYTHCIKTQLADEAEKSKKKD